MAELIVLLYDLEESGQQVPTEIGVKQKEQIIEITDAALDLAELSESE